MVTAFDAPVGTEAERATEKIWPGDWIDATGYAASYPPSMHRLDFHTGADLNLNLPNYDSDAHALCYACADGIVVAAADYPIWGNIVAIRHPNVPETGDIWSRYAHLEVMLVSRGDAVTRGQPIGRIGNAHGRYAFHLHYDIARVDFEAHPTDWPNTDLKRLLATYFDPARFTREHRGVQLPSAEGARLTRRIITANPRLRIRKEPRFSAAIVGYVHKDTIVITLSEHDGWALIADPVAGWIDLNWTRLVTDAAANSTH